MTPIQSIWLKPRATIREVVARPGTGMIFLLLCLSGIAQTLGRASDRNAGDSFSLGLILVLACTVGPIAVCLGSWIWSHLIAWTGDLLKGRSHPSQIFAAIAWSRVPVASTLPIWGIMIFAGEQELFLDEPPVLESNPTLLAIVGIGALVVLILNIWSVFLLCHTIAEVQGYSSAWKGLLNVFLGALAGMLPIFVVLLLFMFAMKAL